MVARVLFLFLTLTSFVFAQELLVDKNATTELVVKDDPLTQQIKALLCPQTYTQNKEFIDIIFSPAREYYKNERVDLVKVIETLKENGLLELFFKKPQEIRLNFKTNGSPIFFVKILSDTLTRMGYYKYVTIASKKDASSFIWSISLRSEYATDPLLLQKELAKKLCEIVAIERSSVREWSYVIDISHAHLNLPVFNPDEEYVLERSLEEPWFDVGGVSELKIESSKRNKWYPYIAFYDASLHLLKVMKWDRKTNYLFVKIPKNGMYMKLSDLYTLKNIKYRLTFTPQGSR